MAENKKFLDSTGLATVWSQVKTLVNNYIDNFKKQLNSSPTGNGSYVDVTVNMGNGLLTSVVVDDSALSAELGTLSNSVSTNTANIANIKPKTDNITLNDNAFNISSTNGVVATNFTTSNGNLNDVISRILSVEAKLTTAEDADNIINTLKDVINFFNNLGEEVIITDIISDIAENSRLIGTLQDTVTEIDTKIGKLITENSTHIHDYTPAGYVSSSFSGNADSVSNESHSHDYTPEGNIDNAKTDGTAIPISSYDANTGIATLSVSFTGVEHTHVFNGRSTQISGGSHNHSYTPTGSVSSSFTGTEATITGGNHNHNIKISE